MNAYYCSISCTELYYKKLIISELQNCSTIEGLWLTINLALGGRGWMRRNGWREGGREREREKEGRGDEGDMYLHAWLLALLIHIVFYTIVLQNTPK